jgi:SAM-dependent methyltransferase
VYDGLKLPFPDAMFDVIFSQQVVEHLAPAAFHTYFAEQGRVLKPNGNAYYQVPHRLSPYDSHSRTWLIHYLPRRAQLMLYGFLGRPSHTFETYLFLRMPGTVRRAIEAHVGACTDITAQRIFDASMQDNYDGPLGIRRHLAQMCGAPVIGKWIQPLASMMMMREFIVSRN